MDLRHTKNVSYAKLKVELVVVVYRTEKLKFHSNVFVVFGKMAALVEDFCIKHLPSASIEFLTELAEEYVIQVPADKTDNKSYVLKLVLRHLTSATIENSADHGAAVFLKLYQELGDELKDSGIGVLPVSVKQNSSDSESDQDDKELSYRKLRQFKIHGKIGDPGESGCLSFSSLVYQIEDGEALQYKPKEIYTGVIRAITAGKPLRDVLELETKDFSKENLLKVLRSHFEERQPNELIENLRTCAQEPKESAHQFCCRAIALRKQIESVYEDENLPSDLSNVKSVFFRAIYTGLRQNNLRGELRAILREEIVEDQDLLMEVAKASARESERWGKFNGGGRKGDKTSVNKLTRDDSDSDGGSTTTSSSTSSYKSSSGKGNKKSSKQGSRSSKNSPSVQNSPQVSSVSDKTLANLTSAIEKLSASNANIIAEINVLKGQSTSGHVSKPLSSNVVGNQNNVIPSKNNNVVRSSQPQNAANSNFAFNPNAPVYPPYQNPIFRNPNVNRVAFRCQNCEQSNSSYCNHCLKCLQPGHRVRDCPEN